MADPKKKILIIEDEKLAADALKRKLEANGFDTLAANDGKEGLDLALSEKPDLILLDIVLPVMDGITILEKLRQDEWGSKTPVIILSNLSRADMIEKGKEKGVSSYLVKTDWRLDEVVTKVKQELGIL